MILKMNVKFIEDERIKEWLHSKTFGFCSFEKDLILATEDTQLIIEYAATTNKIQAQSRQIKQKIKQVLKVTQNEERKDTNLINSLSLLVDESNRN